MSAPGPHDDGDLSAKDWATAAALLDKIPDPACKAEIAGRTSTAPAVTCEAPASKLLVLSCGHDSYLCPDHAKRLVAAYYAARNLVCSAGTTSAPRHPTMQVTHEWRDLS